MCFTYKNGTVNKVIIHLLLLKLIRRSKKNNNMFSVLPLWKKGRRRPFFFFFFSKWLPDTFSKTTGRPIFSRWPPVFFFLMGPTWTQNMTSVYLGLDSISSEGGEKKWKKIVFFFVFLTVFSNKKRRRKKQAASKKEAGGDAKHVFFLLRLILKLIRSIYQSMDIVYKTKLNCGGVWANKLWEGLRLV